MIIKKLLKAKNVAILLLCLQISTGCKTHKAAVNLNQEPEKYNSFQISGPSEVKIGSVASFEAINNTNSPLTIFNPWQKRIEKFENNAWRKVKIIMCPCSADCNAPPKTLVLKPNEKHNYDWNLKEGWCGNMQQNGILETVEITSDTGLYRLSIDYGTEEKRQTIIKEFKIIK